MNRIVRITHLASVVAVLAGMLLLPATSRAATIHMETVNGDLGSDLPSATSLLLALGTSTVFGTSAWCSASEEEGTCNVDRDRDSFAVIVPAGGVLTSVTLTYDMTLFDGTGAWTMSLYSGNNVDAGNLLASQGVDLTTTFLSLFSSALPLGAGTYGIRNTPLSAGDEGFSMNYRWDFTVEQASAVPEPATLTLLGLGLLGAAARRKRTRT